MPSLIRTEKGRGRVDPSPVHVKKREGHTLPVFLPRHVRQKKGGGRTLRPSENTQGGFLGG